MGKRIKSVVGLIPARGGSKGIIKKNIKRLNGKPLIAYTIEAALKANAIDRLIVSTDDKEIASVAQQYGAEVPFLRPRELAQDDTPDKPVYLHLINWLLEEEDVEFEILVNLRPTTPQRTAEIIDSVVSKLHTEKTLTSVRTVTKVEGVFHPYWMFRQKNGTLMPFIEGVDLNKYYRRQLLPTCYRLNGVVDALKIETLLNNKNMFGERIGFIEVEEHLAVDIDNQLDFDFCEFLIKKKLTR